MKGKKSKSQELKEFGYVMGVMLILIFSIIIPLVFDQMYGSSITLFDIYRTPIWPWLVACCFWLSALIWPKLLQPVYIVWMKIGSILGWINTRIIMLLMFYGMMLPIGMIMRILGKNPMGKKGQRSSYRVASQDIEKDHLERPY